MKVKELSKLKVAISQMNVSAGRPDINAKWIIDELKKAEARKVRLIVFPELCVPGYFIGDLPENECFVKDVLYWNERIVSSTKGFDIVVVFGSFAVDENNVGEDGRTRIFNAGYVAKGGKLISSDSKKLFATKTLMPNYRVFNDSRHYFSTRQIADEVKKTTEELLSPFEVNIEGRSIRLGVMLCEDMWHEDYAVNVGAVLKKTGADVLINISCSPWSWQKNRKRHSVVKNLLKEIGIPMIYANNTGSQNTGKNILVFDGSSTIYNNNGGIIFSVPAYESGVFDFVISDKSVVIKEKTNKEADDTRELFDALKCATSGFFNTLPKRLKKVTVGVSGGIDSSAALAFYAHVLGNKNVTAINMPYKGLSSKKTRDLAKVVAKNIGVKYEVIPITDIVDTTANAMNIKTGTDEFKSIQARARMEILAGFSHKNGGIFSCNANKVESAFGYGTLNGDLRGAFALWGDCTKREVYQIADYLNKEIYGREVISDEIFNMKPMDELSKEAESDPFDYGDVERRGYHDEMVRAFVEFRKAPEWFLEKYIDGSLEREMRLPVGKIRKLFPADKMFIEDLERCWSLFHSMIFKRVQSVPSPLISKRAFGTDYREAMLPVYFTNAYKNLKESILK